MADDRVEAAVARARRNRVPATMASVLLVAIAVAATYWAIEDPTPGHQGLAAGAIAIAAAVALVAAMFWVGATREGYIRVDRWMRRFGGTYHDPTSKRLCPQCGLPMDVLSPDFYTGPRSPNELCHRCNHSDDLA
ncbi:MAG TPA: hypothetical protein VM282_25610 [Acidimicrobiales bacterium]|nr:hypothetical protein [Acidimicrobiales bacterium]